MSAARSSVLLIVALVSLPSDSASQFVDEAKRIIGNKSVLSSQLQDFQFVRSRRFDALQRIFQLTGEQIPRGAEPLPTNIIADYVPWPRRVSALPEGEFPLYFPRKGQEHDRLGRLNPIFAPLRFANDQIWYFPFDRNSLKVRYPLFAPVTAFFFGNSTTRFVLVPWRNDRDDSSGNVPPGLLYWAVPVVKREGEQPEYELYFFP